MGELRSMAMAFQGARHLFSILQHVLVDQRGHRLKLSPLVKQALKDWEQLAHQIHHHPVPITNLVPRPPHYLTAVDASKQGMGGFWLPTNITLDSQPCVWRASFLPHVTNRLVSTANPLGYVTNSDLELTALITGASTLARSTPNLPHYHIHIATDNSPTQAWVSKGSTSSITMPAFLLCHLAQQCRAHRFVLTPHFTPGTTNTIADFCSRSFHLSNDDFL